MSLPAVRFTVRRMMVTVALLGLVIWPLALERKYEMRAVEYEKQAVRLRQMMYDSPEWRQRSRLSAAWGRLRAGSPGALAEASIVAAAQRLWNELDRRIVGKLRYHEAMGRKYRDAASPPWFPVETDPPEPS